MKWTPILFILFYIHANGQQVNVSVETTDTFSNAIATASALDILFNSGGITNEGHIYIWGSKLNVSASGVYSNAQLVKFDLTNKHITTKTFDNNVQGLGWYQIKTFDGTVVSVRGTGVREVYEINFKIPDSINIINLGPTSAFGSFPYSFQYGRDSSIGIGNSSTYPCSFAILRKGVHQLALYPQVDSSLDYTYQCIPDNDGWVYLQFGQSVYRIWAYNVNTGQKKLLLQRNDIFMDIAAYTNGVFAYRNDQNKWYKLSGGDTTLVAANYNKGTRVTLQETNYSNEYFSSPYPYVTYFYDSPKEKLYYLTNSVPIYNHANDIIDSISFDGGVQPKNVGAMMPDKYDSNVLVYIGNPYGYIQKYFIAQDSVASYGYPGLNVYSAYQKDAHTWYFSGYPSGTCVKWVDTVFFSAETWVNGAVQHISSTTNPKLVGYFASYAGFDHANDLTLVDGRYLCAVGNNIRDETTSSVGVIDITTDSMYGWNDDQMIHKSYVDIEAYGKKLMYSTNNNNGGVPYLYKYDPAINLMLDSITFGFRNYGKIFTIGDLLMGIAQDTSNATHTIDSTIFYKVNLSTKQLSYYRKVRGAINKAIWMPDGYLGVNFTITATPASSAVITPIPSDFYLNRSIGNMDYKYGTNGDYYCVPSVIVRHNHISTYIIDAESAEGKQKILQQWLH